MTSPIIPQCGLEDPLSIVELDHASSFKNPRHDELKVQRVGECQIFILQILGGFPLQEYGN